MRCHPLACPPSPWQALIAPPLIEFLEEVGPPRVGAGFYILLMVLWAVACLPLCAVRAHVSTPVRATLGLFTMVTILFGGMSVIFGTSLPLAGLDMFWKQASVWMGRVRLRVRERGITVVTAGGPEPLPLTPQ